MENLSKKGVNKGENNQIQYNYNYTKVGRMGWTRHWGCGWLDFDFMRS